MSKTVEFDELCERVAVELPEGWEIQISLQKDSGDVKLFDPDGEQVEYPSNMECTSDEVDDALSEAVKLDVNHKG